VTPLPRISDYPRFHAEQAPDRIALRFGENSMTYAELAASVDSTARALIAHGVAPGDRVALLAAPRPEFLTTYLATASIGAVWQGLNPGYTERELAYVLGDARPTLVLSAAPEHAPDATHSLHRAMASAGLEGVRVIDLLDTADEAAFRGRGVEVGEAILKERQEAVDPQDPAMIVYTSGTTGDPKGALIRHSGLVRLGLVESTMWGLEQPVVLCNLPINHIGSVGDLCGVPLVAGGTVVLRESFDAEQVLDDVARYGISALFQVPTQLQRIAALPGFATARLDSLRTVGWGGSALPQDTIARFRARGVALTSTYGLTEATFSVTYTDPDADDEVLLNTVGRPDADIDVRLLGADGAWLDHIDGQESGEGEVCLRHPATMAGYLNRPEATAAAYTPDGWLRTGDVGRLRADGNLVLVGRLSQMFKSGGYNVYPREIEMVLEDHPAVASAAVVARPDPDFQEVGVAFVELLPGAAADAVELKEWARDRLAGYKVPKEFITMDQLPLLPVGKVDKTRLKNLAAREN
jgi:long-chain acyl-CoA synthetase